MKTWTITIGEKNYTGSGEYAPRGDEVAAAHDEMQAIYARARAIDAVARKNCRGVRDPEQRTTLAAPGAEAMRIAQETHDAYYRFSQGCEEFLAAE